MAHSRHGHHVALMIGQNNSSKWRRKWASAGPVADPIMARLDRGEDRWLATRAWHWRWRAQPHQGRIGGPVPIGGAWHRTLGGAQRCGGRNRRAKAWASRWACRAGNPGPRLLAQRGRPGVLPSACAQLCAPGVNPVRAPLGLAARKWPRCERLLLRRPPRLLQMKAQRRGCGEGRQNEGRQ